MSEGSNSKKNKPQGSRGLLKSIIKALFSSVVDLPQQERLNKNIDRRLDSKSPEDLNPEKKLEVKEAAEGLKERLQKLDADNQSIGIKAPNQTSTQDIKTMKR